jgi:hypothetical protein
MSHKVSHEEQKLSSLSLLTFEDQMRLYRQEMGETALRRQTSEWATRRRSSYETRRENLSARTSISDFLEPVRQLP